MTAFPKAANHEVTRSLELYEQAGELIPGWTQLISRRADQFAHGVSPIYAQRAKGSRFVDVDENEYIDWMSAVGAIILGHADEVVDGAVKEQIDRGSLFSANNPLELELAEELNATIPSSEMVRYAKGGGDACAVAVRIARGVTGRDKILICGYHGWHDWYQAANYEADPESGEFPFAGIEPIGVPKALAGTVIPFVYGDLEMLAALLDEHAGEVAAIMMEPARSELPAPGYLETVQEMAAKHGVVLIFDEVSCGWRLEIGGVQEAVGVTPDMTVVAKAMSNGYPMGAVVGSRAVMEPAKRMFISSSYWSDNVGLAASVATIRELKRRNSPQRFKEIGENLRSVLDAAIADAGLEGACTGLHTSPAVTLKTPDGVDPRKVSTLFIQEMARRGVHTYMNFKATLSHTEEDVRLTGEAAAESLRVVRGGLERGNLDELIEADLKKEPFRRLVR
ncbi:MAG: aminotransferase class III-fold pyridoxal phosphate-dependent enzyme [Caldilineaceae bacterium]|nr:aminotransferase class III-fold pyridoxal phosphate-dependent enzyme [Caldilineaceae bacterium]MCY4093034.1 aminotransferase class III-fold pyridoxal phosphate-dependent enzyme [Caldilineaceae bacterium]MDE0180244.1 aminotransferase class III-fold pyridoxal phosphate-dependent enzyme [Caldilineaceae bacterium]